jgi:nucleoside-diphosphate-sugar epimerase
VGGDNLQLSQIAESVREVISRDIPINVTETDDLRSYRIESGKIKEVVGFVPKKTVRDAIEDLVNKFKANQFNIDLFGSDYVNIKKMQELNLG